MDAYTLKEDKNTKILHLFIGSMLPKGCNSQDISICSKMERGISKGNIFICLNENEARKTCAELGRIVCANCVSHLYE